MDLRYPVGKFDWPEVVTAERLAQAIDEIAALPALMRAACAGLSEAQLDTPYRPDGWTVRQVVHHTADSHINSYVRFRLALTEDEPTIKPYKEALWAELADGRTAPVDLSLSLLDAMHARWVMLLRSMSDADFARTFRHPERGLVRLDVTAALYAWHGRHHLAHIAIVRG